MSGDKDKLGKRVDLYSERFHNCVNGAFRRAGNFLKRNYVFPVVFALVGGGTYGLLMSVRPEPPAVQEQLKELDGPIANDYQPGTPPNPTGNDIHLHDVLNGNASLPAYWRHRAKETKKSTEKRIGLSGEQLESLDTKLTDPPIN